MSEIALASAYTLLFLIALWNIYVLVMGIYRAHLAGRLVGVTKYLSMPTVIVGYLIDVMANYTVACLLFLDFPAEALVTDRLKRYKATDDGWRKGVAEWVCERLLDPFDPTGDHC